MNLQEKFLTLEDTLNEVVYEREEEVHSAILAILSKRHFFMVGEPGIAKSMLITELVKHIEGFGKGDYFKHLLTKWTTPEELFGPPDFTLMKDQGIYKRNTEGYLPQATYVFLDEIFKANSSILNSLLTALNEGEFDNHEDDPSIPLECLFAASNEIPTSTELAALADRLHFWHHVKRIQDSSNFARMLTSMATPPANTVTIDEIHQAQESVLSVEIPEDIIEALIQLAQNLAAEEIEASDRRFHQSINIIKAEAWLRGVEVAEVVDIKPLQHVMWRDPAQIMQVRKIVLDVADPLDRDVLELRENLETAYEEYKQTREDADSIVRKQQALQEFHTKLTKAKREVEEFDQREKALQQKSRLLASFKIQILNMGRELLEESKEYMVSTGEIGAEDE